jgi:uncharacterized protein YjbI with pentapeptide repeats
MTYADLSHADLTNADLSNCHLKQARLHRIVDERTRWSGADLTGHQPTDPDLAQAEDWKPKTGR